MRQFSDKEIIELITELEDIEYYIRYTEKLDKGKLERKLRDMMGKLWNKTETNYE